MTDITVRTKGLKELERILGKLGPNGKAFRKRINADLAEAGKIVEAEAHNLIREKRLVGGPRSTGRLDRMTRTVVHANGSVFVRSSATNRKDGYEYPRRYEFQRGGERAFLYPALKKSIPAVMARLDRTLAWLGGEFER